LPGAGDRPGRPGAGDRPGLPGGDRPGRPGDGDRPGRPGAGDRPGQPGDRPGAGDRPGRPGERPNRPGGDGDRWPERPTYRPGNRDPNFNNRPGWANINNNTINNIHNNWNTVINRPGTRPWYRPRPEWSNRWNQWGSGIRNNWYHQHWHNNWFRNDWWTNRWHDFGCWHYGYGWGAHNWNYWWTVPVWGTLNNWFSWSGGANAWQEPYYYDYGADGNVVYQDNSVYIGGQEIASAEDFAASAADLATVPPPATEEAAEAAEWMPLGTFALSTNEKETDPSRVMQLAVDRQGVVSGTLYNIDTDVTQVIQGKVDKETQRVAFRFGESDDIVAETGLYNLTQDEVPLLVHYGSDRTETYLLVRLDAPPEDEASP
jgi:hypothetical protein